MALNLQTNQPAFSFVLPQSLINSLTFCLQVCKAVKSGQYPFVMCNFAPPDMVGHTGKYKPAVKGCEATGMLEVWNLAMYAHNGM